MDSWPEDLQGNTYPFLRRVNRRLHSEEYDPRSRIEYAVLRITFPPDEEYTPPDEEYTGEIELIEYYRYHVLGGPRIVVQSLVYEFIYTDFPNALNRSRYDIVWEIMDHELNRGNLVWKMEITTGENEATWEKWSAEKLREMILKALKNAGIIYETLSENLPQPCDGHDVYPFLLRVPEKFREV